MGNNRWLSTDEIAEYLGVKRDTIYKWIDRHDLPAHKVGRLWKFRQDEIDTWIVNGNEARHYSPEQQPNSAERHN